jgi:hypothetical protein
MKIIYGLVVLLLVFSVNAAAQYIPTDKYVHITQGMTEAEVISRLGYPGNITEDEAKTTGSVSSGRVQMQTDIIKRYNYIGNKDAGEKTTIIHFRRGKVIKIERF